MRILLVNKMYYPDIGGVETAVRDHAVELSEIGRVTVLCVSKRPTLRTSVERDGPIRVVRCASFGTVFSMPFSLVFPIWLFFLSIRSTIVHFHEPFPLASIASAMVPIRAAIVSWHSDIVRQKLFIAVIEPFQRLLIRRAVAVTSSSRRMARHSKVLRRAGKTVTILPYWLRLSQYEDQANTTRLPGLPEEYMLFLGRLSYYKGLPVLLDAIEKTSTKLPLVIIGTGALSSRVHETVRRFAGGRKVIFWNRHIDETEKHAAFAHCRFFLFPSTHPSETFGITQLEAMAYGKPVINTDLPTTVPEVSLHGETGLTVPIGDADALAEAIERLSSDDTLLRRYGENARARVQSTFAREVVAHSLVSMYRRLLDVTTAK